MQNKQITTLSLRKTNISSLERLAGLPLTHLNISETFITDSELEHLTKMSLVDLNLERCAKLTDNAITHLAKITTLQALDLSATPIRFTDNAIGLLKTMNLRLLDIREIRLEPATISSLQSALQKGKIKNLSSLRHINSFVSPQ